METDNKSGFLSELEQIQSCVQYNWPDYFGQQFVLWVQHTEQKIRTIISRQQQIGLICKNIEENCKKILEEADKEKPKVKAKENY